MTDAEYLAWLQDDRKERVVLVEAQAHDGSSVVTLYFASTDYVTTPSESPANISYEGILREVPRFSNSMAEAFNGASRPALGEMVIENGDGQQDAWLLYAWTGYPVKLYLGDRSWPRADFRLIVDGVTNDLQARNRDTLTLKIRDKQDLLNKQAQTTLYTTGVTTGKPKPLCYGEVYQIEPVLIDATTHKYQVHDGPIQAISQVYENGFVIPFTADIANGAFTLPASPAGTVTADVLGAKPGGVYLTKVADIANDLITRAGFVAGDIDSTSLSNMNTTCPQTVGIYLRERENLMATLDELVKSVGGFYGMGRNGKFQMGRLSAPTGVAVLELSADDIEDKGVEVKTITPPLKTVRFGYKRYHTKLGTIAGGVTETFRADLIEEYRVVVANNTVPEWPEAEEPDLKGTALAIQSEAQTEVDRLAALYAVPRRRLKVKAYTAPQTIEIGQEVKITYPRYGLDTGEYGIVVAINESPTSYRCELEIWL